MEKTLDPSFRWDDGEVIGVIVAERIAYAVLKSSKTNATTNNVRLVAQGQQLVLTGQTHRITRHATLHAR